MNSEITLEERQMLYFFQDMDTIGRVTLCKLKEKFGSFLNAYKADEKDLVSILKPNILEQFIVRRNSVNPKDLFQRLERKGVRQILIEDDEYPLRLKEIVDAPLAIYVKNELPKDNIPSVAIIGSRGCSEYGKSVAVDYSKVLATNGIQVISGLAMGIDGIAQLTAYNSGGMTFGVLGCGVDICYPKSNQNIYDELANVRGGLISEYTLGVPGAAWHFPLRNRIISALSDAVIVIEAREKSGTLITVDAALEQGKDIYALPGRIYDRLSDGCNSLIKQGAYILTKPDDFIEEFMDNIKCRPQFIDYVNQNKKQKNRNSKMNFNTDEEKIIYQCMDYSPMTADEICIRVNNKTKMSLISLNIWLTNMTVSGYIKNMGCGYFVKI